MNGVRQHLRAYLLQSNTVITDSVLTRGSRMRMFSDLTMGGDRLDSRSELYGNPNQDGPAPLQAFRAVARDKKRRFGALANRSKP